MATLEEQLIGNKVQELYIGLIGRAGEKVGLEYWVSEIMHEEHPLTLAQVRENFVVAQDEVAAQGIHDTPRSDVINTLYNNLFERAPEAEGLAYWSTGAGKDVSVDNLISALIDGANHVDRTALDNKVEAANYFANYTSTSPAGYNLEGAKYAVADVSADHDTVDQMIADYPILYGGLADHSDRPIYLPIDIFI